MQESEAGGLDYVLNSKPELQSSETLPQIKQQQGKTLQSFKLRHVKTGATVSPVRGLE